MNTSEILRENFVLISVLFALAIGVATTLIVWLFTRAVADVPPEDRVYKDPPPLGFRLFWLPIQWCSHFMQPLLTKRGQATVLGKLKRSGLDYSINPAQYAAARLLGAIFVAASSAWILGSFDKPGDSAAGFGHARYLQVTLIGALCGWIYPAIWLRDRLGSRKSELMKSLPFFLDLITLCVEAGLNIQGAINQAVLKGPKSALRDEFQRVLRDIRAGKGRAQSLREMADRLNEPGITNFVTAVIQAEVMGMSLGPVLRAQADQRRSERFLRAEKLAMEAPVKMLFPLIAFIFPCTFVVLFFPIVMKFMQSGI